MYLNLRLTETQKNVLFLIQNPRRQILRKWTPRLSLELNNLAEHYIPIILNSSLFIMNYCLAIIHQGLLF